MIESELPVVRVSEVMETDLATTTPKSIVMEVARTMAEKNVGTVIVVDKNRPVGIVTERDLVTRVMAKGRDPITTYVGDIMSRPLIWVRPTENVVTAIKVMNTKQIRHLAVLEGARLVGVVTDRGILLNTPQLLELAEELLRVYSTERGGVRVETVSGYCESCNNWSDKLVETEDGYICEKCAAERVG
ncbi:MAG: CBS domain-containing protein [Thermoprotei archaeon]